MVDVYFFGSHKFWEHPYQLVQNSRSVHAPSRALMPGSASSGGWLVTEAWMAKYVRLSTSFESYQRGELSR